MFKLNKYDSIIVGTGPLSVLRAVLDKKRGKKVLLVDDKREIGGAWGTLDLDHIPPVDIGCHILDYDKAGYDFLQNTLNIQMDRLKPYPVLIYKGIKIPYHLKTLVFFIRSLAGIVIGKKKERLRSIKDLTLLPVKYQYFSTGSNGLKNTCSKLISENDIETNNSCSLLEVNHTDKNELEISTSSGKVFCDKLLLTSCSKIQRISSSKGHISNPIQQVVKYIHLHVILKECLPVKCSYWRVIGHPVIHRISDVTPQLNNIDEKNEHSVIVVGIHESYFRENDKEEIIKVVSGYLMSNKIIQNTSSILSSHFNVFECSYLDRKEWDKIEDYSGGLIQYQHSSNFIFGLKNLIENQPVELFT